MSRESLLHLIQDTSTASPRYDFEHAPDEALFQYRKDLRVNTLPGGILPKGVAVERVNVGGIPCDRIEVPKARPEWLLLQIHGGAFCAGTTCCYHWPFIKMGMDCHINILSVDYRLAPEHPYPAALEDCFSVYRTLLKENWKSDRIIFVGEAAGGTLCFTTALYARDHGLPVPAAILTASPCADLAVSNDKRASISYDDPYMEASDTLLSYYIGTHDPKVPWHDKKHRDSVFRDEYPLQRGSARPNSNAVERTGGCENI